MPLFGKKKENKEPARENEQVSLMKKLEEIHNDVNFIPKRIPILRPSMANSIALSNQKMLTNNPSFSMFCFLFLNEKENRYMLAQMLSDSARHAITSIETYMLRDNLKPVEWVAIIGNEMNIDFIMPRTGAPGTEPGKAAVVQDSGMQAFINSLQYSRDHFTETEPEKILLSTIIKRVEIKYAEKPLG